MTQKKTKNPDTEQAQSESSKALQAALDGEKIKPQIIDATYKVVKVDAIEIICPMCSKDDPSTGFRTLDEDAVMLGKAMDKQRKSLPVMPCPGCGAQLKPLPEIRSRIIH